MRAVLDPNVIISGLLSPEGSPARVIREWLEGAFDLVVSRMLLDELDRVLRYPKLRKRITATEAERVLTLLERAAEMAPDPAESPPARSEDPDDDYLIALAASQDAFLVSGDADLLGLADRMPVVSALEFLDLLAGSHDG